MTQVLGHGCQGLAARVFLLYRAAETLTPRPSVGLSQDRRAHDVSRVSRSSQRTAALRDKRIAAARRRQRYVHWLVLCSREPASGPMAPREFHGVEDILLSAEPAAVGPRRACACRVLSINPVPCPGSAVRRSGVGPTLPSQHRIGRGASVVVPAVSRTPLPSLKRRKAASN